MDQTCLNTLKGILKGLSFYLSALLSFCWLHSQAGSPIILTKCLLTAKLLSWFTSLQLRNLHGKRDSLCQKFQCCHWIESHWTSVGHASIPEPMMMSRKSNKLISVTIIIQAESPRILDGRTGGRKQATLFGTRGLRRVHQCYGVHGSPLAKSVFPSSQMHILIIVFSLLDGWVCPCDWVLANGR